MTGSDSVGQGTPPRVAGLWSAFAFIAADFSLSLLIPHIFSGHEGRILGSLALRGGLAAVAVAFVVVGRGAREAGLGRPRWRAGLFNLLEVVGAAVLLLGVAFGIAAAARAMGLWSGPVAWPAARATAWTALSSCVLFPIIEEGLYRGVLYLPLERAVGPGWAIFLSGIVFQGLHFAYGIYAPHYFFGGILLAWSFRASGSLFFPLLLHGLWNALVLLFGHLASAGHPATEALRNLLG
jgi:membrane protease YdiL (CAAX protease family)